jgi:hypothetical protein
MKILLTNQFTDTIATGVNHSRELPVKVLVLLPFILHLLDRTMAPPYSLPRTGDSDEAEQSDGGIVRHAELQPHLQSLGSGPVQRDRRQLRGTIGQHPLTIPRPPFDGSIDDGHAVTN